MYIVTDGILPLLCATCEKNLCITQCCLTLHIIVAWSQFCISPFVKVRHVYIGGGITLSLQDLALKQAFG